MKSFYMLSIISAVLLISACANVEDNKLFHKDYVLTLSRNVLDVGIQGDRVAYFKYLTDDNRGRNENHAYLLPGGDHIKSSDNPLIYALGIGHAGDTIRIGPKEKSNVDQSSHLPLRIAIKEKISKQTFAERQIIKEYGFMPDTLLTDLEKDEVINYMRTAVQDKTQHCTHLGEDVYLCTIREGTADVAGVDELVAIYYSAILQGEFKQVEGNYNTEKPFIIQAGTSEVIAAWRRAIPHIYRGSRVVLIVPAEQAYGDKIYGKIPANSDLLFLIDLY